MMTRDTLVQNAMARGQDVAFTRFAQRLGGGRGGSKSRSLFGKLSAVLRSVEDNLDEQRRALEILQAGKEASFQGVKLGDLRQLIELLYCERGQVLPVSVFGGYSAADLLGHLEVCRRYFLVAQEQDKVPPQPAARTTPPKQVVPAYKAEMPEWKKKLEIIGASLKENQKEGK